MATMVAQKAFQTKALAITGTAKAIASFGFSTAELTKADRAVITAFAQPVVIAVDGNTPTSTLGTYVGANDSITIDGNLNINNLQIIKAGATDSTASMTLYAF